MRRETVIAFALFVGAVYLLFRLYPPRAVAPSDGADAPISGGGSPIYMAANSWLMGASPAAPNRVADVEPKPAVARSACGCT